MVDAHSAHATTGGAHHLDERLVEGGTQPPRDEGWQAPRLPRRGERVRWRPYLDVERHQILEAPGVGAVGRTADSKITDQFHPGNRRSPPESPVGDPLHPGVELAG